ASVRPIWVSTPAPDWNAKLKVAAAPPRAKVAWYVRPPTLKANVLVGINATGKYASKLDVAAPEPRASLVAMWTIPVGVKVKVAPPELSAGASARAKVKLGADGRLVAAPPVVDVKGDAKAKIGAKVDAKIGVKAPDVHVKAPNVKAHVEAGHAAAVKAA